MKQKKNYDILAVQSFALSIIGSCIGLIVYPRYPIITYVLIVIPILLGIASLLKNREQKNKGLAIAGIVISLAWFVLLRFLIYLNSNGLDI